MLKNLIYLSGFSLFVVIVIIFLNIYHANITSTLPATTQQHIKPISSTFDTKTLDELKKRTSITINLDDLSAVTSEDSLNAGSQNTEEKSSSSSATNLPTPALTQTPTASSTGEISPTPNL